MFELYIMPIYEVEKEVQLTYRDKNQNSGCLRSGHPRLSMRYFSWGEKNDLQIGLDDDHTGIFLSKLTMPQFKK